MINIFIILLLLSLVNADVDQIPDRYFWYKDYDGGNQWGYNGPWIPASASLEYHNGVPYLRGTSSTTINWGSVVGQTFTICTLARYTPGGNLQQRVFNGDSVNWFHQFFQGYTAEAYYGGWNTDTRSPQNFEWTAFCGQNAGEFIFRRNGGYDSGYGSKPTKNKYPNNVLTNGGMWNENSDFDVMEIITWNRALNSDEINTVLAYMENKLLGVVVVPPCSENNIQAVGAECECSTSTCSATEFCYDGTCYSAAKDCVPNTITTTGEQCQCGTSSCESNEFCYSETCNSAAKDCVPSTISTTGEQCQCGTSTCDINEYCYSETCNSAKKSCTEIPGEPTGEKCNCSGNTCVEEEFCYSGLCNAQAKANGACPMGWTVRGTLSSENDIAGNGLGKFWKDTIEECKDLCLYTTHCQGFMYGGEDDGQTTRCQLTSLRRPNNSWGTNWRFCSKNVEVAECPAGYTQQGTLSSNNHVNTILGTSSEDSIDDCKTLCDNTATCVAFMYGGENLMEETKCELSGIQTPEASWGSNWRFCKRNVVAACPADYTQHGTLSLNNDVHGQGAGQYNLANIDACKDLCENTADCMAFMYGNEYYGKQDKCEISRVGNPNTSWGTNWRFCRKDSIVAECPAGYTQQGTLSADNDIAGIGLGKFRRQDIDACKDACEQNAQCVAFMYGGSANDLEQNRCELSEFATPNNSWGNNWRYCAKDTNPPRKGPIGTDWELIDNHFQTYYLESATYTNIDEALAACNGARTGGKPVGNYINNFNCEGKVFNLPNRGTCTTSAEFYHCWRDTELGDYIVAGNYNTECTLNEKSFLQINNNWQASPTGSLLCAVEITDNLRRLLKLDI